MRVTIKENSAESVRELKDRVFGKEIKEDGKNVRLIYQGKVLQDAEPVSKYALKEGVFVHAFITAQVGPRREDGAS
jgi:hypothetical protein